MLGAVFSLAKVLQQTFVVFRLRAAQIRPHSETHPNYKLGINVQYNMLY